MPSLDEFRFASEANSSTQLEWGAGNSIELCGLGSQPLASQHAWDVPDFAARRVAHATSHLYSDYHHNHAGQTGGQQLAEYAAKTSQTLMTITGENEVTDETSIQIYHERAMWDLLRIFFVDAAYQPCLSQALVGWMRSFYSLYEDAEAGAPLLQEVVRLTGQVAPEDESAYWPLAQKLLALGWVQEAGELLEAHSVYTTTYTQQQQHPNLLAQHTVMERMSRLLHRMPFLGVPPGGVGVAAEATAKEVMDFAKERSEWVAQVRGDLLRDQSLWQRAEMQSATTTEGLTQMVAIMCGGEEAIGEACDTWPELLTARLCHMYPILPLQSSLGILLDKCLQEKGESLDPCMLTLQDLLTAIGEQEIQSIMRVCSERGSAWLPAHVPDLLLPSPGGAAVLDPPLPHLGYSQVEFYVLEYASSLAEGATTWQHALQYYACCPRGGRHAAESLIQVQAGRLGLPGVGKLLRLATELGLGDLKASVCRVQGHKALQEGRLGQALQWFLALDSASLANDAASGFLSEVAEAITRHPEELLGVSQLEVFSQLEDLQSLLSQQAGSSDTLGFLHALLEFQLGMLGDTPQDAEKAARALEALLKNSNFLLSEGAQKLQLGLALDLLLQGRSLLEHTPPVFSVADIENMRQTLQGLMWRADVVSPKASQEQSAKVAAVSLALESALLY